MKVVCLSVGKKHNTVFVPAIEEYEKRLRQYVEFSFELVPSSDKEQESRAIMKRLRDDDAIILLDERGDTLTNRQLTAAIDRDRNAGTKRLVIIIGGAYGVDEDVRQRSNAVYSISGLVLPHQLVRLLVVEQLYRTFNTLAGGKYHHA